MEGSKVRSTLVIFLSLYLLSAKSEASFGHKGIRFAICYAKCMGPCVVKDPTKTGVAICAAGCVGKCIINERNYLDQQNLGNSLNQQDFCEVGCAVSLCNNISSLQNIDEYKVESCVSSCSGKCSNR